jgi:hypothetical protein
MAWADGKAVAAAAGDTLGVAGARTGVRAAKLRVAVLGGSGGSSVGAWGRLEEDTWEVVGHKKRRLVAPVEGDGGSSTDVCQRCLGLCDATT